MNLNKTKYLCIRETTHNNLKLDKNKEIEFCQEYNYLRVIFDTGGRDDKERKSRVYKQENV
jgi:ABC-type sulfate transport system substrate-binding protein